RGGGIGRDPRAGAWGSPVPRRLRSGFATVGQRLGPGWRGALPRFHIIGPPPRVLLGRDRVDVRGALGKLMPPARLGALLEDLFQERDAPAAAGPGAAALGELARHPRLVQPDPVDQLPTRHVEAQAHLVVQVHRGPPESLFSRSGRVFETRRTAIRRRVASKTPRPDLHYPVSPSLPATARSRPVEQ